MLFRGHGGSRRVWPGPERLTGRSRILRPCGRELHVALSTDEVGVEGRTQRVPSPGDAFDSGPGFARDGVIHEHNEGASGGQAFFCGPQHRGEEFLGLDTAAGVEPVVGTPVVVLPAGGAEDIGQGEALLAEEGGEKVAAQPPRAARGAGGKAGTALHKLLDPVAEPGGGVFFSTGTESGAGERRVRMR